MVPYCLLFVNHVLLSNDVTRGFKKIRLLEEQLARLEIATDREKRKKD